MHPGDALVDPVFHVYVAITVGLLVLAGAILAVLSARGRDVRAVWRTYRSWVVVVAVMGAAIVGGRGGVIGGTMLLSLAAFGEFARATGIGRASAVAVVVYAGIVAVGVAVYVGDLRWFAAMPALVVGAL